MLRTYTINAILIVLSLILFFGFGEILARAFFPSFVGHISDETLTVGKRIHRSVVNELPVRLPYPVNEISLFENDNVILIIGDSISFGFGHAYEDIYWRRWQRRLELDYTTPPAIISISEYGNNFSDNYSLIDEAIRKFIKRGINVRAIIYQFNYNDLVPFTQEDIKERRHIDITQSWIWETLIPFRQKYLNRSVLLRVASHYIAKALRSRSTDCRERGATAVPYAYAFGAIGLESQSLRAWSAFENGLKKTKESFDQIPFFVLISPLEHQIDREEIVHVRKWSVLRHCMTIDARSKVKDIATSLGINVVDPTDYLIAGFKKRIREGNPAQFYFLGDMNHMNELGSQYFSEFGYSRIIMEIMKNE